jgi:hypothetical protein
MEESMFDVLPKWRPVVFFQADGKDGGGTTDTSSGGAADAGKADVKADAKTADAKAGDDAKDKKPAFEWSKDQQDEINRIMGETRKEERRKAKADLDADVAKAKKEAEDKELQEKQEFKTLAEKRQAEIDTLKKDNQDLVAAKEQSEKYKAALEKNLKAQTEKLPKHIKTLLSKMDVLEQMEYLSDNAKDLGVKLDAVDATPRDSKLSDAEHEVTQSKDMRRFVRSIT